MEILPERRAEPGSPSPGGGRHPSSRTEMFHSKTVSLPLCPTLNHLLRYAAALIQQNHFFSTNIRHTFIIISYFSTVLCDLHAWH